MQTEEINIRTYKYFITARRLLLGCGGGDAGELIRKGWHFQVFQPLKCENATELLPYLFSCHLSVTACASSEPSAIVVSECTLWYTSGVKLGFFIELCKRSRGGGPFRR
jgi:hypothetical protein